MELTSLHPLDPNRVATYLRQLDEPSPSDEREANALTFGLARFVAEGQPIFFHQGLSLTTFEARIDRGIGMLMRPPSRLFIDAGMDSSAARALPIRLDVHEGMMGGAFVPPRLVPNVRAIVEERMKRILRRLNEAEYDAVATLGLFIEAVNYADERGLGLYEAIDVVDPHRPESWPRGAQVLVADVKRLDRDLRRRLEAAAKPEKRPGLLQRMLGRSAASET